MPGHHLHIGKDECNTIDIRNNSFTGEDQLPVYISKYRVKLQKVYLKPSYRKLTKKCTNGTQTGTTLQY